MRKIKLTQGKFALVDDADFDSLNKFKWYAAKKSGIFYACRKKKVNGFQVNISMHREILGVTDPKILVDHKNRNGIDNQRCNLRFATPSQNSINKRSGQNSTSKYLGVSWFSRDSKWVVHIKEGKRQKHIGYYFNEIEAAKAYNSAAIKIHGQFANLNEC